MFVSGAKCSNPKCNFVHKWLSKEDCFFKDDKVHNKDIFEGQKNYAYKTVNDNWETIKDLMFEVDNPFLPPPQNIYIKVQDYFKKKHQNMTTIPRLQELCGGGFSFCNDQKSLKKPKKRTSILKSEIDKSDRTPEPDEAT